LAGNLFGLVLAYTTDETMREQTENHTFGDVFHYKDNQDKTV